MKKYVVPRWFLSILCMSFPSFLLADGPAPSASQVSALARQLETDIRQGDAEKANALFDIDALSDRMAAGVAAPAPMARAFRAGMQQNMPLMRQLAQLAKGGQYRFLRVRSVGGENRALFRLLQSSGLNYHEWIVVPDIQGRLRFVDVYIAVSGETLSQTLHRSYVMAAAHANPTLIQRLTGADRDFAKNLNVMLQMIQHVQARQYQQALDVYATLPKSLQDSKNCMILRLAAAEKLRKQDEKPYQSVMNDFERLFPGDPCLDLVCVDEWITLKKFMQARQALDRLQAFTGGDPYLGVLRGNLDVLEGSPQDLSAARTEYETAKIAEPDLAAAYWALVTLDLKAGNYDATAAELSEIQRNLHLRLKSLEGIPLYADFVQSDAYKKWKSAHGATNAPNTPK